MKRFFLSSFLSLLVGFQCFAQVSTGKDMNVQNGEDRPGAPMRQESTEDSRKGLSQGRPERDMSPGKQMPGVPPQGASPSKASHANVPGARMGDPMENRNIRLLEMRINTNKDIAQRIRERQHMLFGTKKGIGKYMLSGALSTGTSILFGAIDDAIGAGINALFKAFKGHHDDWRQMNQKENTHKDSLAMCTKVTDFYSNFSTEGALDPEGMQFDGITLEKKENGKTIFKLVTHLDTSEDGLDKIIKHSKFSLVVDTLFFDIKNCGLPNRETFGHCNADEREYFSFDTRRSVSEKITLTITTSYISPSVEVFKDVKLGSFDINLEGLEATDTLDGFVYRYENGGAKVKTEPIITGECFIVPRSFNGMRDEKNEYNELYGSGEYKVDAVLVTTCQNTPEFEKNWKDDWKAYKERKKRLKGSKSSQGSGIKNWVVQYFDSNYKSWVTKMIKAPVSSGRSYINQLIQEKTGSRMGGMQGGMPGGMQGGMQGGMMEGNGMQPGQSEGGQGGERPQGNQEQGTPQDNQGQGGPQGNQGQGGPGQGMLQGGGAAPI